MNIPFLFWGQRQLLLEYIVANWPNNAPWTAGWVRCLRSSTFRLTGWPLLSLTAMLLLMKKLLVPLQQLEDEGWWGNWCGSKPTHQIHKRPETLCPVCLLPFIFFWPDLVVSSLFAIIHASLHPFQKCLINVPWPADLLVSQNTVRLPVF